MGNLFCRSPAVLPAWATRAGRPQHGDAAFEPSAALWARPYGASKCPGSVPGLSPEEIEIYISI